MQNLTAIVMQEDGWWIGWIEEIPGANAQERTKEELLESLKEAAKDIIEINRERSKQEMPSSEYEEISLAI